MQQSEKVQRAMRAMLAMQRYPWEQGVAAQAMLEAGEMDTVVCMAHDAVVRQADDGRLGVVGGLYAVADPCANGEPCLAAYAATGQEMYRAAAQKQLDYLLNLAPHTQDGVYYHNDNDGGWIWVDAMYMLPPFLAAMGRYDEAVLQEQGLFRYLWDADKRALSHIYDSQKKRFQRKAIWGVGNGWFCAGIVRVLSKLPKERTAQRQGLVADLVRVLDGCLAYQRTDGLFHDVLDDATTFVDANSAQMFAYSIYRGVAAGYLAPSYLPAADAMRQAANGRLDTYGLVQGVCGSPHFDHSGTAAEAQAFYILMETAAQALDR